MHQSKLFKFLLFVFVLAILTPAAVFAANTKSLTLEHNGTAVNGKTFYMDFETTDSITIVFDPTDAVTDITVKSSNPNIVDVVFDGTDTVDLESFAQKGTVTITVSDKKSGKTATVRIGVQKLTDTLSFTPDETEIYSGKSTKMDLTIGPDDATNKSVVWRVYENGCLPGSFKTYDEVDPECKASPYASISSIGILTGKTVDAPTDVDVAVCASDGGADCHTETITIKPLAKKLTLEKDGEDVTSKTVYMEFGDTATLDVIADPTTADTDLEVKSSNENVVEVTDNGDGTIDLTAKDLKSTATITVKDTLSGRSTTVRVVVQSLTTSVSFSGESSVYSGRSTKMEVTVEPDSANQNVVWRAYEEGCDASGIHSFGQIDPTCVISGDVTISSNGVVTGKTVDKETTVVLVMCAVDGGAECDYNDSFTVKPLVRSIIVECDGDVVDTKDILSVEAGDSLTLVASPVPDDADHDFSFKSSNEKIATVDASGEVTGVMKGLVIITITDDISKVKTTVRVRVLGKKVTDIEIQLADPVNLNDDDELIDGKSQKLKAVITPDDADIKTVKWSVACQDPSECPNGVPATITSSGVVTATHVNRKTTIVVTAEATDGSGVYDEYEIVVAPKAKALRIVDKDYLVTVPVWGDPGHYHANDVTDTKAPIIKELNDTDKYIQLVALLHIGDELIETTDVTWKSSNEGIAIVDTNGLVTFLKSGTVTITATTKDGSKLSRTATLTGKYLVKDIIIKSNPADVHVLASGKTLKLTAVVKPETAANKKVRWYSDDPLHAATVNENTGLVTAKTVTVCTAVNIYAVATDVNPADQTPAESDPWPITICPVASEVNLYDGSSNLLNNKTIVIDKSESDFQIYADTLPTDASNEVIWTSSNKNIATVDDTGYVVFTGKTGTVTITAKAMDGSGKSAKVTFQIGTKIVSAELYILPNNDKSIVVRSGTSVKLNFEISPANATNKKVAWEVTDTRAINKITSAAQTVTVTANNLVNAICTDIIATTQDGSDISDTVEICVVPSVKAVKIYDYDTDVDLTGQTIYLAFDAELKVGSDIYALNYPDDSMMGWTWATGNKSLLDFDGTDTFTASSKNTGTTTITAKAIDGTNKSASVKVVVYDPAKFTPSSLSAAMAADDAILIGDMPLNRMMPEGDISSTTEPEKNDAAAEPEVFTITGPNAAQAGETVNLSVTGASEGVDVYWFSSDETAATVDGTGAVTIAADAAADTVVTITAAQNNEEMTFSTFEITVAAAAADTSVEEAIAAGDMESLVALMLSQDPVTGSEESAADDSEQTDGSEQAAEEAADQPVVSQAEAEVVSETSAEENAAETSEAAAEEVQDQNTEAAVEDAAVVTEESQPADETADNTADQTQVEEQTPAVPAVSEIVVDVWDDMITITSGETFTLEPEKLAILPAEADWNTLTFEVENEYLAALESDEIAKIREAGLQINALAAGETKLIIKSGDVEKVIRIVVEGVPAADPVVTDEAVISQDTFDTPAAVVEEQPAAEQVIEEQTAEEQAEETSGDEQPAEEAVTEEVQDTAEETPTEENNGESAEE